MKQNLRLGTIAGIRIGVHWSVLVIMALLVQILALTVVPMAAPRLPGVVPWLLGVAGAVVFLLSLLAHELAHALVARAFGMRVEQVTLWLLGGIAELGQEPPSARADLLTAGAGPAVSALLGAGFGGLAAGLGALHAPAGIVAVCAWLAGINLLVAAFNLLPGAPLDGGRVLRAALWHWRGDRYRAAATAATVGRAIGLGLIFLGLSQVLITRSLSGLWLTVVGWFLISAAAAEATTDRYRALLGQVPVSAAMHTRFACTGPHSSVAEAVASIDMSPGNRVIALRTPEGRPAGLARLTDLARVPEPARAGTPVSQVAAPLNAVPVIEATRPLADVAYLVSRTGTALVVDHEQLVGVLDANDIAYAAEHSGLHAGRPDGSR
ncbi:site-2 protease family protein [Dactylosporangium fulvum]|uniref:Zinc metalloprotease n=1 Tax=Dactylosporangium fulvum TaxID=53359 RepID=A0ABY5VR88_9ACTN|nr:site-2 protease family protein [Dactylosporangium fulvum]UWP79609.1 site-2 protease family protein [Dactylosporangium fulvum]